MSDFTPRLPDDHECTEDETCHLPTFLRIEAVEGEDGMDYQMEVHRLTTSNVAETLVRLFDTVMVNSLPADVPRIVAHSRAREYLIQAAEQVSLAPDAAVSLEELLQQFVEEAKDD